MEELFDVDAVVATLLPWNLVLKIGGMRFRTRAPSVGEIAAIEKLAAKKDKGSSDRTIEIVAGLFEDGARALNAMTMDAFVIAARKILVYARERQLKNSGAVAAAVPMGAEAATAPATSGSSSPQS